MIRLSLEIEGEIQVDRSLSRFGESLSDLRPAFKEIAKSFHQIMKKQFDTEGRYGSGGWAPLSPTYADWKAIHFPGKPILQASGQMKDSLTGGNFSIEKIDKLDMTLGTSTAYAVYHQLGTSKMPQRKLINLTEQDKKDWMKIIQRYAVNEATKAGLR